MSITVIYHATFVYQYNVYVSDFTVSVSLRRVIRRSQSYIAENIQIIANC